MYGQEEIKLTLSCYQAIPKIAKAAGKKWKWEPKVGEWCIDDKRVRLIIDVDYGEVWITLNELSCLPKNRIKVCRPASECIPIFHWEVILLILRDLGYTVGITLGQTSGALVIYHEKINTEALHKSMSLSKVQPTVMQAVIELGKEMKK